MEKLTVVDALDERDFLRKKIISTINGNMFVAAHRIKDAKINGRSVADIQSEAASAYQSINDLIDRYHRIDIAITESNAKTQVKLRSGREMTVAAAIALRKSIKDDACFEEMLVDKLESQYISAINSVARYNEKANTELESYKTAKLSAQGKESGKLTDDQLEVIEKFVADLYGELLDPLDLQHKLADMKERTDNLSKELDSAIKISNATTYVEF